MIIFDGLSEAKRREQLLKQHVATLTARGAKLCIASVVFREDPASWLYTTKKSEAAARVGIQYRVIDFSFGDAISEVVQRISELNADPTVTGVMVQKPSSKTWRERTSQSKDVYQVWWQLLSSAIDPTKDVDGLHPQTLAAIKKGCWQQQGKVLPATCAAVLAILDIARGQLAMPLSGKHIVIGRSELLGLPLCFELRNQGVEVELLGSMELATRVDTGQNLTDAQVIVSATGRAGLVTAAMVAPASIVIDVGEPRPDVDTTAIAQKVAFLTPVPGGVGPMTVVCLLENCVRISV